MKKNETEKDYQLRKYIETQKLYTCTWVAHKTKNAFVQKCLENASKQNTGEHGEPDLIYLNENERFLILLENKDSTGDHKHKGSASNPSKYATDGIKWYLSFFTSKAIAGKGRTVQDYFKNWKMIGIAVSGDINDKYNHLIDTYRIAGDTIVDCKKSEILNEADYLALFENIDNEALATQVSKSSIEINKKLRSIDSQKRPILLSALMICLYDPNNDNDFKHSYASFNADTIADTIPLRVKKNLEKEYIPSEKIDVLVNELAFLKTDIHLRSTSTLKDILIELQQNVIPLFDKHSSYDIIGKFYEEFLRYAGITNVKKGIVLTPHHITELFTKLINLKTNDCVLDCCCGTGAFLVAAMNAINHRIDTSDIANKTELKGNVKQRQLIGFESNSMMYTLAISNMLFRGDGKSQIYHEDFFSKEAEKILAELKGKGITPSIGFINPPYGGKDNKDNPTKKEIQFIERMLDSVSRYLVVIAPLSTFFNDEITRNRILTKHTLKYVINMPKELFMPNAATNTAIAVFETNTPQLDNAVLMCELADDGFVLSKNRGRTDILGLWKEKETRLLDIVKGNIPANGINIIRQQVKNNDEWILQAHSNTDYDLLSNSSFEKCIKEYVVFTMKDRLNIVDADICEIDLFELIGKNISNKPEQAADIKLNTKDWKAFKLGIARQAYKQLSQKSPERLENLFVIDKGERIVEYERMSGEVPLITASAYNNGRTSVIDKDDAIERKKMLCENRLTIDMFCNVFYHQYEYFSDDNVHTLSFTNPAYEKFYANTYVNIFLQTILSLLKPKFDFGRQVRLKRLENLYIKLPVTYEGEPDWQLMEQYIKSLPYSCNL